MYFQGFVIPVPTAAKAAYRNLAAKVAPVFAEYGARQTVECWGDEVMVGKVTDLRRAVRASDEETVVLSWVVWPDRATCDGTRDRMLADPRIQPDANLPFDATRMIYGGFEAVLDTGGGNPFGYLDGKIAAAPSNRRDAVIAHGERMAGFFRDHGATRFVDGWGVDVPAGKVTDFHRAVDAGAEDAIVFGWVEWPDKATRNAGMAALMQDQRMRAEPPAWNGATAIFGGFVPLLDTAHE